VRKEDKRRCSNYENDPHQPAVNNQNLSRHSYNQKGANLAQTWNDLCPLHIACCVFGKGNASLVHELLEAGADPMQGIEYRQFIRARQLSSFSSTHSPAKKHSKRQYGSEPSNISDNQKDQILSQRIYPLDIAVTSRNRDVVSLLLKRFTPPPFSSSLLASLFFS